MRSACRAGDAAPLSHPSITEKHERATPSRRPSWLGESAAWPWTLPVSNRACGIHTTSNRSVVVLVLVAIVPAAVVVPIVAAPVVVTAIGVVPIAAPIAVSAIIATIPIGRASVSLIVAVLPSTAGPLI